MRGQAATFNNKSHRLTRAMDCLENGYADARGKTTVFGYDSYGRLAKTTDPMGHQKQFSYDLNGNLTSLIDPNGNTITYTYDLVNRLTRKTLPGDLVT